MVRNDFSELDESSAHSHTYCGLPTIIIIIITVVAATAAAVAVHMFYHLSSAIIVACQTALLTGGAGALAVTAQFHRSTLKQHPSQTPAKKRQAYRGKCIFLPIGRHVVDGPVGQSRECFDHHA